jgi:dTDP-4-dehydrorhamnose reductase
LKEKIYIAGGGGMLGEAFYRQFSADFELKVTDIDVNEQWIDYLDFRDANAYLEDVKRFNPAYLFHLGAQTNLEYCETNTEDAYLTNTKAAETAVHISNELNIPLLYISTAGIFDGREEAYEDDAKANPMGHYAMSKYLGEKFVTENKKEHLVCRAGWMMGGGPQKDKKFVGAVLRQIFSGDKQLNIVNDRFGTPTYTNDFARNVKALLTRRCWGLYNVACAGNTSRMQMAREILKILGKENEITLKEVGSDFYKQEYFAPRPASEVLINAKLDELQLNLMRDWKICLREYISKYWMLVSA